MRLIRKTVRQEKLGQPHIFWVIHSSMVWIQLRIGISVEKNDFDSQLCYREIFISIYFQCYGGFYL